MKKTLSLLLAAAMLVTMLIPATAFGVTKPGSETLKTTFTQNLSVAGEQIKASVADGILAVTGTSTIKYNNDTVAMTLTNMSGGTSYTSNMRTQVLDGSFAITKDLSEMEPGVYRVNLFPTNASYGSYASMTKGMYLRVGEESGFVSYSNIESANTSTYSAMSKAGTSKYKDTSLADIKFVNRNPETGASGTALTTTQQSYIKKKAEAITATGTTTADKAKLIYEFVADRLYYDTKRVGSTYNHPYYNLYHLYTSTSGYNYSNKKVAVECTGYAAMEIALARAIGIPARMVNGFHKENTLLAQATLKDVNHHWAEFYVNGTWIRADSNAGSLNTYDSTTKTWKALGPTNYSAFAPTTQQMATQYIVRGPYVAPLTTTISTGTTHYVKLSWNKVPVTGYKVQIAYNSTFTKGLVTAYTTDSYKKFTSRTKGKKYYVRVTPYLTVGSTKRYFSSSTKSITCK